MKCIMLLQNNPARKRKQVGI